MRVPEKPAANSLLATAAFLHAYSRVHSASCTSGANTAGSPKVAATFIVTSKTDSSNAVYPLSLEAAEDSAAIHLIPWEYGTDTVDIIREVGIIIFMDQSI